MGSNMPNPPPDARQALTHPQRIITRCHIDRILAGNTKMYAEDQKHTSEELHEARNQLSSALDRRIDAYIQDEGSEEEGMNQRHQQ
jgi:prephenate dehydrogenase